MNWNEEDDILPDSNSIVRIYSDENRSVVVSDRGSIYLDKRLNEVETRIDFNGFARISQTELVNCKRVQGMKMGLTGCSLKLDNGSQVFVAKRFVPEIKRQVRLK